MGRLKIEQEDGSNKRVAYLEEVQTLADDVDDLEDNKVDKVAGKGLSTSDYTAVEKTNVGKIPAIEINVGTIGADLASHKIDYTTLNTRVDTIITTPVESVSAQEIIDARQGELSLGANLSGVKEKLLDVSLINDFYKGDKNGEQIVMIGDSTTEVSTVMYSRFAQHQLLGGLIEGAIVLNRGSNGNTLNKFVNGLSTNSYNINSVITELGATADAFVICYGINDIRGGIDSPGRTADEIKSDMVILLDRLLSETNAYILLRTPNTFLSTDPTVGGYLDDIANAQKYTDELYNIYESFRGYDKRVDVIDLQSLIFGRECRPYNPLVKDTLHPSDDGYRATADEISFHISTRNKKVDFANKDVVVKGYIISNTNNVLKIVSKDSYATINVGDVVFINNDKSFVITQEPIRYGYVTEITIPLYITESSGIVCIAREKEQFVNKPDYSKDTIEYTFSETLGNNRGYLVSTFDISGLGLTGVQNVEVLFDTYTDISDASVCNAHVFLNNNFANGTITGGTSAIGVEMPFESSKSLRFKTNNTIDTTGQTAMHLQLVFGSKSLSKVGYKTLIKSIRIVIGGHVFYGVDAIWEPYNILVGSGLVNYLGAYRKDIDDWAKVSFNKEIGTPDIKAFTTIDLTSYGLTGSQLAKIMFNYYTEDSRVLKVIPALYFNTNSTTVNVGGNTVLVTAAIKTKIGEITEFKGQTIKGDITDKQYLHIMMIFNATNGTNLKVEFGDIKVWVGDIEIEIPGNGIWTLTTQESGSTVDKGAYRRDLNISYNELKVILNRAGINIT